MKSREVQFTTGFFGDIAMNPLRGTCLIVVDMQITFEYVIFLISDNCSVKRIGKIEFKICADIFFSFKIYPPGVKACGLFGCE